MQANRHQRVLQRRANARVRMDVPGRDAPDAETLRDALEAAVAGAIVAQERPLQLDAETVCPKRIEQPPERELVVHPAQRATAQADQPLRVVQNIRELDERLRGRSRLLTRVGMRAGQDPAQVGPAARVLHEQRQVAAPGRVTRREVDLGAVDRTQPERPRGDRELHRPRDRVVVGQGNRFVPELERGGNDLVGQRGAVEEREGRVAMKFDVWRRHSNTCSHPPRTMSFSAA